MSCLLTPVGACEEGRHGSRPPQLICFGGTQKQVCMPGFERGWGWDGDTKTGAGGVGGGRGWGWGWDRDKRQVREVLVGGGDGDGDGIGVKKQVGVVLVGV
jgi:hypothetical protein